jgi:glutamyl-Q tRNA(Asp) synthetase
MTATTEYIGRFAPTPSGPLHFGSLVTAVGSFLDARSQGGQWLLRIEDVDRPRVVPGASDDILATLERFGLLWDGPVLYQSERIEAYEAVLQQLRQQGLLYACSCSRRQLIDEGVERGPLGLIYPGHCRDRGLSLDGRSQRLRVESRLPVRFDDRHAGEQVMDIQRRVGDVVLKRTDGIHAYHLAVVVDDAFQGITDIVRGADLLDVSFIHRHLASLLDYPLPRYLHLPLVYAAPGRKLSKQTGAQALDTGRPGEQLWQALEFLGQQPEAALKQGRPQEILQWGVAHWQPQRLPEPGKEAVRA